MLISIDNIQLRTLNFNSDNINDHSDEYGDIPIDIKMSVVDSKNRKQYDMIKEFYDNTTRIVTTLKYSDDNSIVFGVGYDVSYTTEGYVDIEKNDEIKHEIYRVLKPYINYKLKDLTNGTRLEGINIGI